MSKKEKVNFSHGENFESVEDLLTSAMEKLDEANSRILKLLESDSRDAAAPPLPHVFEFPVEEHTPAAGEAATDEKGD